LPFLNDLGVKFGGFVTNIGGDYFTPLWIFSGFILVLLFKNSIQIVKLNEKFNPTRIKALYFGFLLAISIFYMYASTHTEFIYFNF